MNDLRRELAPIVSAAWTEIDDEAKATLEQCLAARRVVDFDGPGGWERSAVGLGRIEGLKKGPGEDVDAALRRVQPLVELRAAFALERAELDAISRGAQDADLDPVRDAARSMARAEDRTVFHGFAGGGITGICEAASDATLTIPGDYERFPEVVAAALSKLRDAGVSGPYAIALGPQCYTGLSQTITRGGFPVMQHVQRLLDGPIHWAPSVDGAVVLSQRGGDFVLSVGRDLSVGYQDHDGSKVRLYLEQSMTFRVLGPEAAVPLVYDGKGGGGGRKR